MSEVDPFVRTTTVQPFSGFVVEERPVRTSFAQARDKAALPSLGSDLQESAAGGVGVFVAASMVGILGLPALAISVAMAGGYFAFKRLAYPYFS